MLELLLINTLSSAYVIEVWLNTNAFIEYMCLFGFRYFFRLDEYFKLKKEGYPHNYVGYLSEYHDCFIVRLLICATCLSFWFAVFNIFVVYSLFDTYSDIDLSTLVSVFPLAFLNLFLYRVIHKLD